MGLSDLASLASVLGSLAVCGTLIYLALQVQQSDRNQRTLLQQATSARNMESLWKFGERHNAEVVSGVWNGETDFTNTEATQLAYLMRATMFGFQDQFLLQKLSLVPAAQGETQERGIKRILSAPAFRALWPLSRDVYAPEFTRYIDGLLMDVPVAGGQDFASRLKATADELKATTGPSAAPVPPSLTERDAG